MTKRKTVGWVVFAALLMIMAFQLPRVVGYGFYVAGSTFYSDGNYEAAAKAFQGAVRVSPGFARGYVELGSTYLALKDYRKAEKAFLKASSLNNESCAACGLGMTYNKLERYDDAEKAFSSAVSLNPDDACAYYQSGKMYYERGKYLEAIAAFKRAVTLRADSAIYVYIGNSYVYTREFAASIEPYKEAIRLDPRNIRAHLQLGIAYDYLARYGEAVEEYKKIIQLDPDDEEAYYYLAQDYVATGNKRAALEVIRKINPDKAAELVENYSFLKGRKRGKEKLYFIPLGDFPTDALNKLTTHCKEKPGINAVPTQALPLGLSTIDPRRQQVIAEEVVELMKRKYPKLAADPNAVLIGLTDEDMYIREKTWQFAFSYWTENRFAVVSSARMNPVNLGEPANADLLDRRMRKMVLKNIGLLYYLLPDNHDPRSVLYSQIDGVKDLDNMGEDF